MFELKDVCKYYHNDGVTNRGLNNINLKLEKGEIAVITGESGSGKSTLLNIITKQDNFDEGEIYFYGNETSYFSIDDMDNFRKNKIGFIFQNYNIIDSYTVLENVMLPLIINDVPYKEAKAEAMEIIKKVGLEKWYKNRGSRLSGGQKQRCVIARALASRCEVLACDEPTGNLDSQTGDEIVKLIKEVAKDKLVLIVTHNYDQFKSIATRKIKVHDGEIVEDTYIEKKEEDQNKELQLDYEPVGIKTDSRIALNNLKSTPRKTMLLCLITLFTAFFAFFLYQICYGAMLNSYKSNPFIYQGSNKVIAYDKGHNLLNLESFDKYKYETNLMSEQEDYIYISDDKGFSCFFSYEPYMPKNYNIKAGVKPSNYNEILILFPTSSSSNGRDKQLKKLIKDNNKNFYIYDDKVSHYLLSKSENGTGIVVSGVGYSKNIAEPIVVPYTPEVETNESLSIKAFFKFKYLSNYCNDPIKIDFSTKTKYICDNITDQFNGISFSKEYSSNIMKDNIIKEVDENIEENTLVIGNDYKDYENVYQASIYGKKSNIKKKLNKLDYSYIDVKKFDDSTALERFVNNLTIYIVVFLMTFIILLIYCIASIILSKVFSSKAETYAIFRTLGVTKRDMKKILNVEVLVTVISMTIFNLFISLIFHYIPSNNFFFEVYSVFSFKIILLYLLVMLLIAIMLSKKFNKKLFKNSVTKTLKEAE